MNLLFIDKTLNSLETFISGCNDTTKYIVYDVNDTFTDLNEKILDFGISSFQHIGFVFENNGLLKLFVENNPFVSFNENGINENLTTQFIKSVVNDYNVETVDFLACDLLLDPTWKSYFEYLQVQCSTVERNVVIRASNNKSGNLQHGGDWILESTNEDVTNLYFNENISEWSYLLGFIQYYNSILLNDQVDNLYTTGTATNNIYALHRAQGDFRNSEYIFQKNIISIENTFDSFAFITDETSNNLYVLGNNISGKYGLGNTSIVSEITKVTSSAILNKKVISVKFTRSSDASPTRQMYVLTDESLNNLYSCGTASSTTYMLGLGTTTTTNNLLTRITYLNKKVLKILCNSSTRCELIIDEPSNNIFYLASGNNGTFLRLNDPILYDKKAIDGECHEIFRAIITSETSNNLYVKGGTLSAGIYGLGPSVTSVASYTNVALQYSTQLLNKKVEKIFMTDTITNTGSFILTSESSNNLYTSGPNNVNGSANLGIGNTTLYSFQKVSNYSSVLLNKKILSVNISARSGLNTTSVLTNELTNNLYSTGYLPSLYFGTPVKNNNYNTHCYTFVNVSLTSEDILNKYVKLLSGIYIYTGNTMIICLTNESPLVNSNIYLSGFFSSTFASPIWNIDNSIKKFKKIRYVSTNKKFIKHDRSIKSVFLITDETNNNLYGYINNSIGGTYYTLTNISNLQSSILNKKITDISISDSFGYLLTNESSNNLYGASKDYPNYYIGDGTTIETPNFKKINNNIVNKKVIKVSNSDYHKGILTDELINNYYVCGIMNTNNSGAFGNSLSSGSYSVFTNVTNGIISGKKFIDINCSGSATFLISNESSNNLYACGKGYIGDGSNNSVSRTTFLNITKGISGKKVIKVSQGLNQIAILTNEGSNNLYMVGTGGTGLNTTLTTFTKITDVNLLNKQIIDIECNNDFTNVFTNESINNVYVTGNNSTGQLGTNNRTSLTTSFSRLTYLNNKSYTYVAPVAASNVSVSLNTSTITGSSSQVSYKPKAFNIGNNNKITFPDPLNQTISIAPVSTTTAVQKYSTVLNVTSKNVVSGYIKLEPAGTTFESHVSLQFDVEPSLSPVIYFKSSTDTVPQLIPSTNTSANDVYYSYASSTGTVTLYTKHFSEAIVTQDTSLLSPKVDFNLSYLNVAISMSVSGDILKLDTPSLEGDAIAEYYVLASDMRKVFMFQSDSDDLDTITNGTDVKYFVRRSQWPSGLVLNPCHAWVQSSQQIATTDRLGSIADNRELVKHDFIRHIAKSLFNTHLAVDLFNNEDTLKYDLAYKGHNTAWTNIWNSISSVSDVSLNTTNYASLYGQDASYGYYLTGDASANTNICRQLLGQLIKSAPARLQNLNTYVVDASKGYYSVPLIAGDSISFKLTLQPAPNQHLLVNRPSPVPARTYQIRINLRDNVSKGTSHADSVNVIVNDTSPLTYNGVAVLDNLNTSYPSNY